MLNERIEARQKHLRAHPHDKSAKHRIQGILAKRRKMLRYMIRNRYDQYRSVVNDMGVRPLPVYTQRYESTRGRGSQTHEAIQLRNSRVKTRRSRGHLGH